MGKLEIKSKVVSRESRILYTIPSFQSGIQHRNLFLKYDTSATLIYLVSKKMENCQHGVIKQDLEMGVRLQG